MDVSTAEGPRQPSSSHHPLATMTSHNRTFEVRELSEDAFIFEMAKDAAFRKSGLERMPPSGSPQAAALGQARSDIEAILRTRWQESRDCRSCGHPMTTLKVSWSPESPFDFSMRWFTNLSPDRIEAGGEYSWSNVRIVCNACQLMRSNLAVPVWQDNLRWLVEAPKPEVQGGFLVNRRNGLETHDDEWIQSAQRVATNISRNLDAIETSDRARLAAWEEGQDHVRQTPRS